jgi:hypothetical protein
MKTTTPWVTYRTRFVVRAKQLSTSLTFADNLGRQHSGRKGDYLVESNDGILRIAPRQIFEDIYVPLSSQQNETSKQAEISKKPKTAPFSLLPHLIRKSPQPDRNLPSPAPARGLCE